MAGWLGTAYKTRAIALSGLAVALLILPNRGRTEERTDPMLSSLVGKWRMVGQVMKKDVEYRAEGKWILNKQFLRFSMVDVQEPPQYEAQVFIGYDSSGENYIVHWLDTFGGAYSTTLGTGKVQPDSIELLFPYEGKPFRDIITLDKDKKAGRFLIEYLAEDGEWQEFARYTLQRIE
ncbi:MAG: DUF1579 domain-containing protein [Candidatus Zixiibacteriota bacterium]|nr:MAG: DUF1579 domain-containing protein [candidate division Zixibacteria bacterium]